MHSYKFISSFLCFTLGALILISCNNNEVPQNLVDASQVMYETKKFDIADVKSTQDPSLQSHFILEYPELNDDISTEAKENIDAHIAGFILDAETPVREFPNIQKQAYKLFKEHKNLEKEFPHSFSWLVDKKVKITSKIGSLICLSFSETSFKGGAHPSSYTQFKIFDLGNGNLVDMFDIIDSTKMDTINSIRLKYFIKEKNEIMPGEDWKMYVFPEEFEPKGAFFKNKNLNISKDTFEFYYNSYEIASYAFGPSEVKIPIQEISPFLKQNSPYIKYFAP